MPLRPSPSRLQAVSRRLIRDKQLICPSCQFADLVRQYRGPRAPATRLPSTRTRQASSLASSTAVNATKTIPVELQELHLAIAQLSKDAPNYVNISRLQLALRSLESSEPVVRIAGM